MKKIVILLTSALVFWACSSDFLELHPNDSPSATTYWKTKNDYVYALTACYASMQSWQFSYGLPLWDNLTDNGYNMHTGYGEESSIVQGNVDPTSSGFIEDVYFSAYEGIARVNEFITKLKQFQGLTDDEKIVSEAEARMIRAYFYSYLFRCYGEVPIVSELLTLENQYQAKKNTDEVYKFIMDDIDFAITNLPAQTYTQYTGRWTQNAARAYKARMILYTAYDAMGSAITSKMNEAKSELSTISGYSLAADFSDNFLTEKQESCPEIMMSVKFLAPNNRTTADMWYGDWFVVSPLANFISEFELVDGSNAPATMYTGRGAVDVNQINNTNLNTRDPRLAKTIFIQKYVVNGVEYKPSHSPITNVGLSKFLDPSAQVPYDYPTQSQQDWVIMRYADVLLMLAEVENELGNTSVAAGYVNQVRARSNMPNLASGLSQADMRTRIRRERRVELAFEGQHYFDLKRWKIAKQVLNSVQDGIVTYKFEDKHYLWPLPQAEIESSKGILVQNPDYQ